MRRSGFNTIRIIGLEAGRTYIIKVSSYLGTSESDAISDTVTTCKHTNKCIIHMKETIIQPTHIQLFLFFSGPGVSRCWYMARGRRKVL